MGSLWGCTASARAFTRFAVAESGDLSRLSEFGALLEAHVRFEERGRFPACEALVGPEVLTRVALRAPKGKRPG